MTAEEAYNRYHAIKLHFLSEKYDYFLYHGKCRIKPFSECKIKPIFVKLANHPNLELFLAIVFTLHGPYTLPKTCVADKNLSGEFNLVVEMLRNATLTDVPDDMIALQNPYPTLFLLYVEKRLNIFQFAYLYKKYNLEKKWLDLDDPSGLYSKEVQIVKKLAPFIYNDTL